MTQLDLAPCLDILVRYWAPLGPVRVPFTALCDAFATSNATDLDAAAVEAGVLHWNGAGFDVGREAEP